MSWKRNKPNPMRDAFKKFLKGEKENYPYSIDSESNPDFVTYAKHKLGIDYFDAYACTDIVILHTLQQGLIDEGNNRAKKAMIYGNDACYYALADYADFLRLNGTATNDEEKLKFEKG